MSTSNDTNPDPVEPDYVPVPLADIPMVTFGTEAVAWSPHRGMPLYLDPVALLLHGVMDGTATVADLIEDVIAVVGIDRSTATEQVVRVSSLLYHSGVLVDSPAVDAQPLPADWLPTSHDN